MIRVSGCSGPKSRSIHGYQRGGLVPQASSWVARTPGPEGRDSYGRSGSPNGRAKEPLVGGQQRGELVAGPGRAAASPVQRDRLTRVPRVSGAGRLRTRSRIGSSAANWSRAAAASPCIPGPAGRVSRGLSRVPGWPGRRTCSRMGSSAANWSRARLRCPHTRSSRRSSCGLVRVSGCSSAENVESVCQAPPVGSRAAA